MLKYCNESLKQFCLENGVELCRDYSNELVRRETIIEGKCTAEECDNIFNKSFREIVTHNNIYCKKCLIIKTVIKRQETCLEKHGVKSAMQSEYFKEQIKQTNLEKYGVKWSFQGKTVKEKIKKTNIQRYGVENPNQNLEIREKVKQTNLEKYGVEYVMQSDIFKEKIKNTMIERHGVENASQNETVKDKKKKTCLKNYGVEYPSQNSIIMDKVVKSSYSKKDYIFPSGKCVLIQGYEHFALNELIMNENLDEDKILVGCKNVPIIWYKTDDGKKHRYYVDIYIPSQNRCIEVKSDWSYNIKTNNVVLKQQAAKELGYNYEIWIYNQNGIKTIC
jgi:hypothetical protein